MSEEHSGGNGSQQPPVKPKDEGSDLPRQQVPPVEGAPVPPPSGQSILPPALSAAPAQTPAAGPVRQAPPVPPPGSPAPSVPAASRTAPESPVARPLSTHPPVPRRAAGGTVVRPVPPPAPASPTGAPALQKERVPALVLQELILVVRNMSFVVYNELNSCWLSNSDRNQALTQCFSIVDRALRNSAEIRIAANNEQLSVNGRRVALADSRLKAFRDHMWSSGGTNFTLARGATLEEFAKLFDLMCKSKATLSGMGGFTQAIADGGFEHVVSRKVVFREVSEDEAVVEKRKIEQAKTAELQEAEDDLRNLLSGEGGEPDALAGASVRKVAEDSERMAELVMEVAGEQGGDLDKEEMGAVLVDCLNKAFDALMKDDFSGTQKGKKAIARTFRQLEEMILDRMGDSIGEEQSEAVRLAGEVIQEKIKADAIIGDYGKKLQALEQSEKRILRFIKLQGLDVVKDSDLQDRLSDDGLDISGWHRLLALSAGSGAAGASDDETQQAVQQLATLLSRLGADAPVGQALGEPQPTEKLADDLKEVSDKVEVIAAGTQNKINSLVEAVHADMAAADEMERKARAEGHGPRISRREIITILAEVIQELRQPLLVINCSLGMISSNRLGEATEGQLNVLNLALESSEKIETCVSNLEKIAGLPASLTPDQEIQKALYA